jgi:hypothetical protein
LGEHLCVFSHTTPCPPPLSVPVALHCCIYRIPAFDPAVGCDCVWCACWAVGAGSGVPPPFPRSRAGSVSTSKVDRKAVMDALGMVGIASQTHPLSSPSLHTTCCMGKLSLPGVHWRTVPRPRSPKRVKWQLFLLKGHPAAIFRVGALVLRYKPHAQYKRGLFPNFSNRLFCA